MGFCDRRGRVLRSGDEVTMKAFIAAVLTLGLATAARAPYRPSYANALMDFAADPTMGVQANTANTALYADGTHPTPLRGEILDAIAIPAINALLGGPV